MCVLSCPPLPHLSATGPTERIFECLVGVDAGVRFRVGDVVVISPELSREARMAADGDGAVDIPPTARCLSDGCLVPCIVLWAELRAVEPQYLAAMARVRGRIVAGGKRRGGGCNSRY